MVIKAFTHSSTKRAGIISTILLISLSSWMNGQSSDYQYYYRVYLKNKGNNKVFNYSATDVVSSRAVLLRNKAGIPVPDYRDLPLEKEYIDRISDFGLVLHCKSKWMNSALFKSDDATDINRILNLPFVDDVKIVKTPGTKSNFNDKLFFQTEQSDLQPFDRPLTLINGSPVHNSGFDGKNILIAILDEGFLNADHISSLKTLWERDGIKGEYDFVNNSQPVYNTSTHGTAVLSVLAGILPGSIIGTAPAANYLLLITEDKTSEFPCEEDFWAAGAEYADSAGANIISSSLGYYNFDDPALNYKLSDLDGNSSFVTKVADIAASKGILVVNSAGNERNKFWQRIIFPSDGDSVLAIGAVDGDNNIASFSSAGPSIDGRVKPDNTAMGVSVPVQISETTVVRSDGTSFSCPVISGMAACLMQAVPWANNTDIIEALRFSAHRSISPDSVYGYGTPDIVAALAKLQEKYVKIPSEESIAGPNPTTGTFEIIFRNPPGTFIIEILSMTGKLIGIKRYPDYAGRTLQINDLLNREQGIYFIRIINTSGVIVHKIIKLNI